MLLEPQFRTAEIDALWSAEARIGRMLTFEAELALAQAELGAIPAAAAAAIARCCREAGLDADAILAAASGAGNPAIPFVKALTAAVADRAPEAAPFLHHGSTSQDVIDSAAMMAVAAAIDLVRRDLAAAADALAALALAHAGTPIAGRTLLQQATPVTFGYKAALWCVALDRAAEGLAAARNEAAVQIGGAVGTLGSMGDQGPALRAALARRLGLADPGFCWHVVRDRVLRIGTAFAASCGAAAKVGRDVQLLMQTEIAEAVEPSPGGSTALPHKRNPVDSLVAVAAAQAAGGLLAGLAPSLIVEHERAAGAWHAEWTLLPALSTLAHAAAAAIRRVAEGMTVDPAAMRASIDARGGLLAAEALSAALIPALGRAEGQKLVESLARAVAAGKGDLRSLAEADARVTAAVPPARMDAIFAYEGAVAAAAAEARRLVAGRRQGAGPANRRD